MTIKSERSIRRMLRNVQTAKNFASDEKDEDIAYGAEQTLAWILGKGAAPTKIIEVSE